MANKPILPEKARTAAEVGNFSSVQNTPLDICREIVYYLPVKALIRFRSISKSWKTLIEQPDFISSHLRHRTTYKNNKDCLESSLMVNDAYSKDWSIHNSRTFQKISKIKSPPVEDNEERWIVKSTRDGLLLFRSRIKLRKIDDAALMLWNPSIQKSVYIPPPPIRLPQYDSMVVVLGFDPSEDDYKVVSFVYDCYAYAIPPSFHVFSLKSWSWVEVSYSGVGESPYRVHHLYMNNVSMGEYIHWIGRVADGIHKRDTLVSLNLTTMMIFYIPLPDQLNLSYPVLIGSPFLGHSFIGLLTPRQVWVLEDLHPEAGLDPSWKKMYETEMIVLYGGNDFYLTEHGHLLSWEFGNLDVYDIKTGEERKYRMSDLNNGSMLSLCRFIGAYVESLVLLNWS